MIKLDMVNVNIFKNYNKMKTLTQQNKINSVIKNNAIVHYNAQIKLLKTNAMLRWQIAKMNEPATLPVELPVNVEPIVEEEIPVNVEPVVEEEIPVNVEPVVEEDLPVPVVVEAPILSTIEEADVEEDLPEPNLPAIEEELQEPVVEEPVLPEANVIEDKLPEDLTEPILQDAILETIVNKSGKKYNIHKNGMVIRK